MSSRGKYDQNMRKNFETIYSGSRDAIRHIGEHRRQVANDLRELIREGYLDGGMTLSDALDKLMISITRPE